MMNDDDYELQCLWGYTSWTITEWHLTPEILIYEYRLMKNNKGSSVALLSSPQGKDFSFNWFLTSNFKQFSVMSFLNRFAELS